MEKSKGFRKGFSLVELLIAVVILGILTAMILMSGNNSQQKARVTAAMTVLDDYQAAFSTVCMQHPGVMKDRADAWGADGLAYTSKDAYNRLTTEMNLLLDTNYMFVWDDSMGLYRSNGEDPWGGYYILVEMPFVEGSLDTDGYSPLEGSGVSAMTCSIWATGSDAGIFDANKISEESVGVVLLYKNSEISYEYNNVNGESPYVDYLLRWS